MRKFFCSFFEVEGNRLFVSLKGEEVLIVIKEVLVVKME